MAFCNLSNFILFMFFLTVAMAQVALSCTFQITVRHYLSDINLHAFSYAFNCVSVVLKMTMYGNHFTKPKHWCVAFEIAISVQVLTVMICRSYIHSSSEPSQNFGTTDAYGYKLKHDWVNYYF